MAVLKARDEEKKQERIRYNIWRTERNMDLLPGILDDHLKTMVIISPNTFRELLGHADLKCSCAMLTCFAGKSQSRGDAGVILKKFNYRGLSSFRLTKPHGLVISICHQ